MNWLDCKYRSGIEFKSLDIGGYYLDYVYSGSGKLVITFENADKPSSPRSDRFRGHCCRTRR